jgi:hypothetical protein
MTDCTWLISPPIPPTITHESIMLTFEEFDIEEGFDFVDVFACANFYCLDACVYVCMHMCMYVLIHIYSTHILLALCVYSHVSIHMCLFTCVCSHVSIHMCLFTCVRICVNVCCWAVNTKQRHELRSNTKIAYIHLYIHT